MRNTRSSCHSHKMSNNFYERFKDRMSNVGKQGVQELLFKSLPITNEKQNMLPPIRNKPVSSWQNVTKLIQDRGSDTKKSQRKSDHLLASIRLKKPKEDVVNKNAIVAPTVSSDQRFEPSVLQHHPKQQYPFHRATDKSSLRLSMPNDIDFRAHLGHLQTLRIQKWMNQLR